MKAEKNAGDFKNKRVLVVGLARTGVSAANLLQKIGAVVTITDSKERNELQEHIEQLSSAITVRAGAGEGTGLASKADMLIVSPGVPLDNNLLVEARQNSIPMISEVELAASLISEPIIAVTGTNGKTTTVSLIDHMLTCGGKTTFLGGNIGTPLSFKTNNPERYDYIVAEISSFQLEHIQRFKPFVSVVLNMSPDHLDRHKTMREYISLKKRLYENQSGDGYLVLNQDDPIVSQFGEGCLAKKIFFSRKKEVEEGVFTSGNTIVTRWKGKEQILCSTDESPLKGNHNVENLLSAIAVGLICDIEKMEIKKAITTFTGIAHRMEFVTMIDGISFINDSKGTNVGAVYRALEGFTGPVVLIIGGVDKGNDYSSLERIVSEKVKLLVTIGESKEDINQYFRKSTECLFAESMQEAVRVSCRQAEAGDTVLLSPACASFDMFTDYKDRGNCFKEAVMQLAKEKNA